MNTEICVFSDKLEKRALKEAECFPVDRNFLDPYIEKICSFYPEDFLLCNLERQSNTYTVQLLLCLPEIWDEIDIDNIIELISKFKSIYSYYTFIEFTYKYLEVNFIDLILKMMFISDQIKKDFVNYLYSSLYPNLLKTEGDFLFFKEGLYGVHEDDWIYTRQRLLVDERVSPALKSLDGIRGYLEKLIVD